MGLRSQGLTDPGAPVSLQRGRPGEGEHPTPVLFLHGLASSPTTWADLIPLMDPSCELWFADLPWGGAGRSAWWRRPPADWVGQAIDGLPGGVDLVVAHSLGTNALLSWADAFGARTAGFTEGDEIGRASCRGRGWRSGRADEGKQNGSGNVASRR